MLEYLLTTRMPPLISSQGTGWMPLVFFDENSRTMLENTRSSPLVL